MKNSARKRIFLILIGSIWLLTANLAFAAGEISDIGNYLYFPEEESARTDRWLTNPYRQNTSDFSFIPENDKSLIRRLTCLFRSKLLHGSFPGDKTSDPEVLMIPDDPRAVVLEGYAHPGICTTEGSILNIRREPSASAAVIGKLPSGGICEVLDKTWDENSRLWFKISSGEVNEGYVSSDFLKTGQEAVDLAVEAAKSLAVIISESADCRSVPIITSGEDDNRVAVVHKSEAYFLTDDQPTDTAWCRLKLKTASKGYIPKHDVSMTYGLETAWIAKPVEQIRREVCEFGLRYVGNRYVWDSESLEFGCDCSAFVMLCYRNVAHIELPHYSVLQSEMGRSISASELKPGDLVFYDSMGLGRISHVALYIGDGQVVQALNSRIGIITSRYDFIEPCKFVNFLD